MTTTELSRAPKLSGSFITSAGKASARAWSSGLRGRLALWGRRRQAINKLKRLSVCLPHWLKTSRGAFKLRRVRTAKQSSYKQTMRIYNIIFNYSNSLCPFHINHNNNGATVLESMGCSTWSFQMPCLPGDALCGLPENTSDVWC